MKLAEVIAKAKSLDEKVASLQNVSKRCLQNKEIISELKKKDVF